MARRYEIRNSTAEFLIFQIEGKEQGVEVFYKDKTVWCTQKAMSMLFDCDRSVITKHLGNIFESGELNEVAVCAKIAHTATDGKTYQTQFYSLDAVHRHTAAEMIMEHAETEFEKYRIIQDHLFQSDFDRYLEELPSIEK